MPGFRSCLPRFAPALVALACAVAGMLSAPGSAQPAPASAGPTSAAPISSPSPTRAAGSWVYVGTQGADLRLGRFDAATGTLELAGPAAGISRPTFTVVHPRLPVLYAVSDTGTRGLANGTITAFRINRRTGALTPLAQVDAGGAGTTSLTFDPHSMTLFAANYDSGTVGAFPIERDGRLGRLASLVTDRGSGPHRRQAAPHAHDAQPDPSGRFLLVPDLGADRVFVYPFDPKIRRLSLPAPGQEAHYPAAPGSGPRRLVFGANGQYAYLVNELSADLTTLRWDARAGRAEAVDRQPISSPGFAGTPTASAILPGRGGNRLYVGDRAENQVLVYALDPASGKPALIQRIAAGGKYPWAFSIDPTGRWLLVANQASDSIAIFAVDPQTGLLADSGRRVSAVKPVALTFVPALKP